MGVSDSMSFMISRMDLSWSSVSSNSKIFSNSDSHSPSRAEGEALDRFPPGIELDEFLGDGLRRPSSSATWSSAR